MIDILMVTYNSEKWLEACIESISLSEYDLKQVALFFWDNCSSDDTVKRIKELKDRYAGLFGDFQIDRSEKNRGFSWGNNRAAALGQGELIFCLNVDTTMYPDTLSNIIREVESSPPEVGLWELRQFPYEHPKIYDPITGDVSWSSGACFVIRRELFERLGGFDESFFMYCEDVDLSWRVRTEGYRLRYIPKAVVNHFCYQSAGEIKPTQYIYSMLNNLLLRYKFGSLETVIWWYTNMLTIMRHHGPFPHARSMVVKAFFKSFPAYVAAIRWRLRNWTKVKKQNFSFFDWDYETIRAGTFFVNERPAGDKKVSVLVRTCGRPDTLRETLLSLRNQTYPNVEIVVVEDGQAISRQTIEEEFSDLNIIYEATDEKVGRCAVGNRALQLATGDYCNFLDDDDVFYADHIETLVMELQRHPEFKVAYSLSFDTPITVKSKKPYVYEIEAYYDHVKWRFNRLQLLCHNLFPIQAVMFSKEIFERLGGMDEELDLLEDWDLWVRYAMHYTFHFVEKTTSVYRVPAVPFIIAKRQKELDDALYKVRKKHEEYIFEWRSNELIADYQAGIELHQR